MTQQRLSTCVVPLLKGVLYRDDDEARWQALFELQARVRDYVAVLGLDLIVDDVEGYAFLRQRPLAPGEPELPRLVARRQLSYPVSLLLALLRRKLAEADAGGGDTRVILSRARLVELMRVFLGDTTNEAKLVDRIDQHIAKVVELGFLRRLRERDQEYEIRRILKAFVDAQWLSELGQRLDAYHAHASEDGDASHD